MNTPQQRQRIPVIQLVYDNTGYLNAYDVFYLDVKEAAESVDHIVVIDDVKSLLPIMQGVLLYFEEEAEEKIREILRELAKYKKPVKGPINPKPYRPFLVIDETNGIILTGVKLKF